MFFLFILKTFFPQFVFQLSLFFSSFSYCALPVKCPFFFLLLSLCYFSSNCATTFFFLHMFLTKQARSETMHDRNLASSLVSAPSIKSVDDENNWSAFFFFRRLLRVLFCVETEELKKK